MLQCIRELGVFANRRSSLIHCNTYTYINNISSFSKVDITDIKISENNYSDSVKSMAPTVSLLSINTVLKL